MENPSLRSGKMYFPFGFLSFVPGLKKFVIPRMPRNSHAWMNLDSEARGPMFEYAFHAAVKRTRFELETVAEAPHEGTLSRIHRAYPDPSTDAGLSHTTHDRRPLSADAPFNTQFGSPPASRELTSALRDFRILRPKERCSGVQEDQDLFFRFSRPRGP